MSDLLMEGVAYLWVGLMLVAGLNSVWEWGRRALRERRARHNR